jgi:hypothetical protein
MRESMNHLFVQQNYRIINVSRTRTQFTDDAVSTATQAEGCEVWLWALGLTITLKIPGPLLGRKRAGIVGQIKRREEIVALDQGVLQEQSKRAKNANFAKNVCRQIGRGSSSNVLVVSWN